MPAAHGTRARYKSGCHCEACKLAESTYQRQRRQTKKGEPEGLHVAPVTRLSASPTAPVVNTPRGKPGDVETGVITEIDALGVAEKRPGLVQTAYALARVLDNQLAIAQHPSAARQLSELMDKLRKSGSVGKGKLAAVRAMTRQAGTGEATG
ncbi:hypothetical protein [Mycobacteroides abscessus]|uniref:hypothetical protein n=1 Tax=Mycobacteroides abscessus TaxID=36809 RepID=UPI0009C5FE1B|nr:hypothetical protein [Mycobacteroides abscessus]SKT95756.1 Uncharacterised protein [Mycobacteroides abscessus subsp. massiliense]SKU14184.1 Uncharacterised protein [Mycobacteroides abscessus subsp. massiliense]